MRKSIFNESKIILLDEINSTNDYAFELLKSENADEGTIIWALFQNKGKGQKGNKWESNSSENLTFSIILKPDCIAPVKQFNLNKAISLSLLDLLKSKIAENTIKIKWPNDIYIEKKKIAGILIENQIMGNFIQNSVVGIGLNVNQILFSRELPNPTSLKLLTSNEYNLKLLLLDYLSFIEKRIYKLYHNDIKDIESDYLNNLLYIGQLTNFLYKNKKISAEIIGINEYGQLILKTINGKNLICDFKEICFLH